MNKGRYNYWIYPQVSAREAFEEKASIGVSQSFDRLQFEDVRRKFYFYCEVARPYYDVKHMLHVGISNQVIP